MKTNLLAVFASPFRILTITVLLSMLNSQPSALRAQGTAFTYQGRLNDGTNPAQGTYDLRFTVFDSTNVPGAVVAGPLTNSAIGVTNGLFTVTLDFGAGVFPGAGRWLEVGVRTNLGGAGTFFTLAPRQRFTATPYAITAGNVTGVVPTAGLSGTYSGAVTFNNPANSFTGNGGGLTNVNALTLGGFSYCSLPCYWNLNGNSGTSSGINFVGTTDSQALTFRVNNTVALQYQPAPTIPNVVGGLASFYPTFIGPNVSGAVVAGGNAPSGGVSGFGGGDFHAVYDNDGTVGGGFGNKVGSNNPDETDAAFATVAGGVFNGAVGYASVVAGGDGNAAIGHRSSILGGYGNVAFPDFGSIGGGQENVIQVSAPYGTIAGGASNVIQSSVTDSTIGGGWRNTIKPGFVGTVGATIAGGQWNTIDSGDPRYGTIGGGFSNIVSEVGGTVAGGYNNIATGAEGAIGGGYQNRAVGGQATIAGGYNNVTAGQQATVGGGQFNSSTNSNATVAGGALNTAGGFSATVGGGDGNLSIGGRATIAGGQNNRAYGLNAIIPGGSDNVASNSYSFAAGRQAKAIHDGAFMWADSQFGSFTSIANNEVAFRCLGGARFTSGSGGVNQTVSWAPGSGSWAFSSDRSLKEGFKAVDTRKVLEKVTEMPITEWNYIGYPQRHIGVMAQDFHAAFPLNESTTTLNDADLHGVTIAAIKGLNQKLTDELERRDADNEALREELKAVRKLINELAGKKGAQQ